MAKQLTNLGSDGTVFGQNATDKIGFFGATAVVKANVSASASSSATTITQLNLLISALGTYGLITAGG